MWAAGAELRSTGGALGAAAFGAGAAGALGAVAALGAAAGALGAVAAGALGAGAAGALARASRVLGWMCWAAAWAFTLAGASFGIFEAGTAAAGLNAPPALVALLTPGPVKLPGLDVAAIAGAPWFLA